MNQKRYVEVIEKIDGMPYLPAGKSLEVKIMGAVITTVIVKDRLVAVPTNCLIEVDKDGNKIHD
ncbi:hypothetical protein [Listeria ilorinensis]|uniref:hypothetical protein n=1 Tax=Listeria ilorinensis TaxID=2867439 RepID=UPI001EF48FD2|nr:hypothetical protein [Listeria ilorinensis]